MLCWGDRDPVNEARKHQQAQRRTLGPLGTSEYLPLWFLRRSTICWLLVPGMYDCYLARGWILLKARRGYWIGDFQEANWFSRRHAEVVRGVDLTEITTFDVDSFSERDSVDLDVNY